MSFKCVILDFDGTFTDIGIEAVPFEPLYRRRGRYHDALQQIGKATGTTPHETLVCRDVYEVDLALTAALGAQVVLVERANTLAYERAGVERAGGSVIKDLRELLERFAATGG